MSSNFACFNRLPFTTNTTKQLLQLLLQLEPEARISANIALKHNYFKRAKWELIVGNISLQFATLENLAQKMIELRLVENNKSSKQLAKNINKALQKNIDVIQFGEAFIRRL